MIQNSIIITYYTGLNILNTNLELLQPSIGSETEVIIVNDNPSFSLEADMFNGLSIPVKTVNLSQNVGYSEACNRGVDQASGENLIFMDCDIMPTGEWLSVVRRVLYGTERCGAVSATILSMDTGGVVHWGMGMLHGVDVLKPFRGWPLPAKLQKGVYEFSLLTSGCLIVPRDIFLLAGGFDPLLYNGYGDLDLIMKIRELGYRCVASSEAVVYHRGKVAGQTRIASEEDTRALFVHRWGNRLPDDGLTLLRTLFLAQDDYPKSGTAIMINFSRSLFAPEYQDVLKNTFSLDIACTYNFRDIHESHTLLEDYLSWSLVSLTKPILYFCDNISRLVNNRHWFSYRTGRGDYIADRNGNLISTDKLLYRL